MREAKPDKVLNAGSLGGVNEVLCVTFFLRLCLLDVKTNGWQNSPDYAIHVRKSGPARMLCIDSQSVRPDTPYAPCRAAARVSGFPRSASTT